MAERSSQEEQRYREELTAWRTEVLKEQRDTQVLVSKLDVRMLGVEAGMREVRDAVLSLKLLEFRMQAIEMRLTALDGLDERMTLLDHWHETHQRQQETRLTRLWQVMAPVLVACVIAIGALWWRASVVLEQVQRRVP